MNWNGQPPPTISDNLGHTQPFDDNSGQSYFPGPGITQIKVTATQSNWFFSVGPVYYSTVNNVTPAAGTLIASPNSGIPGTNVRVTGSDWTNGFIDGEYRLFFDNLQVNSQPATYCYSVPDMSFDVPCNTTPGLRKITCQLVNLTTQQVVASKTIDFDVPAFSIVSNPCFAPGITSVDLQPYPNNDILTDNENPANGMTLGKRIFPDKKSPSDTAVDAANRKKVKVVAHTVNLQLGTPIYFKSYDVDDPSNDPIIDPNGAAGNDNRGTPKAGTLSKDLSPNAPTSMCPDANGNCWAQTNNNGDATVEFTVTMNPGDNFMIAASTDPTKFTADANGTPLSTADAKIAPMLTVWRRLHMEADSMGPVKGNQITGMFMVADINVDQQAKTTYFKFANMNLEPDRFVGGRLEVNKKAGSIKVSTADEIVVSGTIGSGIKKGAMVSIVLVDDDDFNLNNKTLIGDEGEKLVDLQPGQKFSDLPYFVIMKDSPKPTENAFADAYIQPEYDWAATKNYNTAGVTFAVNVSEIGSAIADQLKAGKTSLASEATNDFWIAYVQIGYQGDARSDDDPDGDQNISNIPLALGITPAITSGGDAVVTTPNAVPSGGNSSLLYLEVMRERTDPQQGKNPQRTVAPHEVGHQFGLDGQSDGDFGLMNHGQAPTTERFVPVHINMLRYRVSTPGQPNTP